ncbi:hypothetical protein [Tateyamaria sp. SN6-1]|uniref:hypothetical protein n=1 Tax=Tateyamaria sp. SN6-1 TaxID=3092148 RepID=UPI0039F587E0
MTAILDDMRRLDAAYARGDMTAVELAAAKAQLMDSIPDVTPDPAAPDRPGPPADPKTSPTPRHGVVPMLMLCGVILVACAGATLLLTGDLMLSATLAITVLAAFTVMLFRQIE